MAKKRKYPSPAKAKKMLRDNSAHGEPLPEAQKGLFGLLAGGGKPKKLKGNKRGNKK